MPFDLARTHPGVAVHFRVGMETGTLCLARLLDAVADRGGIFFSPRAGDVSVLDGRNFDMKIDPVQERAGDALAITLNHDGTTTAFAFQVAEVTARTRIHRGDEHEFRGKSNAARGAGDSNLAILERLPHDFEGGTLELREFIEKEDAVMGQADFTRGRDRGAAQ